MTGGYDLVTESQYQTAPQTIPTHSHYAWGFELDVGGRIEVRMLFIESGYRMQPEFGGGGRQRGAYLRFGLGCSW